MEQQAASNQFVPGPSKHFRNGYRSAVESGLDSSHIHPSLRIQVPRKPVSSGCISPGPSSKPAPPGYECCSDKHAHKPVISPLRQESFFSTLPSLESLERSFKRTSITSPSDDNPNSIYAWLERKNLQNVGALESNVPQPNFDTDIDCSDIHPVFRYDRMDLTLDEYETIVPAVQLASRWISEDHFLTWWTRPLYGQRVKVLPELHTNKQPASDSEQAEERTGNWKYNRYMVADPRETTTSALAEVKQGLEEMSRVTWISFKDTNGHETTAKLSAYACHRGEAYSKTLPSGDFKILQPKIHHGRWYRSNIIFNAQFLPFIRSYKSYTLCEQLRFQFFVALNLVHELSHAWYVQTRNDIFCKEPAYCKEDCEAELGASWEQFVFGFKIQYTDQDRFDSALCSWKWTTTQYMRTGGRRHTAVPMIWVAQWFRKDTWGAIRKHGRKIVGKPLSSLSLLHAPGGVYVVETERSVEMNGEAYLPKRKSDVIEDEEVRAAKKRLLTPEKVRRRRRRTPKPVVSTRGVSNRGDSVRDGSE